MRIHQSTLSYGPDEDFPHLRVKGIDSLQFNFKWKQMRLSSGEFNHLFITSYLRYFFLGQLHLWKEGWKTKHEWLQFWNAEKRQVFAQLLAHAGGTIFAPHLLGPHCTQKRIVIPGDARLISIEKQDQGILYSFEIPWKTWTFQIKQWPWAQSTPHRTSWNVEIPFKLNTLSSEDEGYQSRAVQE